MTCGPDIMMNDLPPEVVLTITELLQIVWPAGKHHHRLLRFSLGWTVVCHVSSRWREIILSSRGIWARQAFTFYSPRWIQEFIRRSRDAPLRLDLRQLASNAGQLPYNRAVTDLIYTSTIFTRADVIVTACIKRGANKAFSPEMSSLISGAVFSHLYHIDVCIQSSTGKITDFSAPNLETIRLHSDACTAHECPISIQTLRNLITQSPRLTQLYLSRVVDDSLHKPLETSKLHFTKPRLNSLGLHGFSESLISSVHDLIHLEIKAKVSITLYSPGSIAQAQRSIHDILSLDPHSPYDVEIEEGRDYGCDLDGMRVAWRTEFVVLRMKFESTRDACILYRMDKVAPSWTWQRFAAGADPSRVREISMGGRTVLQEIPDHVLPTELLAYTNNLQSLIITNSGYVPCLPSLTPDCDLRSLALAFGPMLHHLTAVVDFLRRRSEKGNDTTLSLYGSTWIQMDEDEYLKLEAPVLMELRSICTVRDLRTFVRISYPHPDSSSSES
ncbi:hypothetical protein PENSPDRAFT_667359 [Peniophora sp. CONT]|nr:hypothetical protein PENSPDRAFT_667359 [Peniophora sp. CONT]